MSSLVKTEDGPVTPIHILESADKVFAGAGAIVSVAAIAAASFSGAPEAWILPTLGTLAFSVLTGNFALGNLKNGPIKEWEKSEKVKNSLLSFFGRQKSYPIHKTDNQGQVTNAQYVVGRGKAYIKEYVTIDPLSVWDSSMKTVREVYSIERHSVKTQRLQQKHMDGNRGKFHKHSDPADPLHETELLISSYRAAIKKMEQNPNCRSEVLEAKRRQLTKLKQEFYAAS